MRGCAPRKKPVRLRSKPLSVSVVVLATLGLSGCLPGLLNDRREAPLTVAESPIMNGYNTNREQALLTLEVLPIKQTTMDGYSDKHFAISHDSLASKAGWDRSGVSNPNCSIRDAALTRDGQDVTSDEDTCEVSEGRWFDPLSGATLSLEEAEPQEFLPTERTWASGGSEWSDEQFAIYNAAPESIMTISAKAYTERGQRGPEQWRPESKDLWCGYALRWVSEKSTYGLNLENAAESKALTDMLDTCPDEGTSEA